MVGVLWNNTFALVVLGGPPWLLWLVVRRAVRSVRAARRRKVKAYYQALSLERRRRGGIVPQATGHRHELLHDQLLGLLP